MEVIVMSRSETIKYCHRAQSTPAVIISITDPNMIYTTRPFCSAENLVKAILPLAFCDADTPGKDVYGNHADESDLMSDEDARQIVEFVSRHAEKQIIVHCDAGISRSSGVAAAIMKYYTNDDAEYFCSGKYCPNMWCYRKTLNAFMERAGAV